jgi:glycosyltransferase involved in cell wall biosynthesis
MLDRVRPEHDPAAPTASSAGAVPVHFLMYNVDARDGVSRAVLTLANHLSLTHPVEVISLYRRPSGPAYVISERVRVTYLFDHSPVPRNTAVDVGKRRVAPQYARWPLTRHPVRNLLAQRRSRLAHGRGFPNQSLLSDRALRRKLRGIHTGVVISTRPALHVALARLARPGVVTIGQDHLNFESRANEPGSMAFIDEACRRGLDAFVTLTASDAADYTRTLAASPTRVTTIPNALSWPVSPPRTHEQRVIVAAGRLVPRKGMARLIRAFAPVAQRHPDWELRIYGAGRLEENLSRRVERSGLTEQVRLMGHTDDLPAAFDDAAVFASASLAEGFPMVMLEALSKGLPLVSFDCPRGPSDIIRDGQNGLLVPNDDIPALSRALETVVADDDLRRTMGAQALADAEDYVVDRVAESWEALFDELCGRRSALGAAPAPTSQPGTA